jgi:hemerythrin-like domain-containing protein
MNTVCDHLLFDHKRCGDLFNHAESCVVQRDWREAEFSFLNFRDALQRHIQMEEHVLLPAFEQMMDDAQDPISLLRIEHRQLLGMLERMSETIRRREAVDFLLHAETFALLKQQHGVKEEEMLYPMLDKLPSCTRENIIQDMREHLGLCVDFVAT